MYCKYNMNGCNERIMQLLYRTELNFNNNAYHFCFKYETMNVETLINVNLKLYVIKYTLP